MSFFKEFREFALKGNVMDMAVGVIIGGYGHEIEMYTVEQGEKRDKRQ